MPIRYDYADLKVTRTDEGYLKDSPIVARTGILTYRNPDGSTRKELRRAEQVFHKDSLASYLGKPITVDHPKGGKVNHENIEQYQVGTMLSEGRQDSDNVRVDLVVHKPSKIGERRQLSAGYDVELIETPGEYNGERYDAEQINIRVNHLSIVKSGRAGPVARLNMDSDEEPLNMEKVDMTKTRLDNGLEYEAAPEVIVALDKLRTDAAAAADAVKAKDLELTAVKKEKDTLQARIDGLPAEITKATEAAKTAIVERAKLETVASTFKVDAKDKTDAEIKTAVIKTFNKDFNPEGKSADYIQASYDIAVASPRNDAMATQRAAIGGGSGDAKRTDDKYVDPRDAYNASLGSNGSTE
jgi:hypothetical protein